MQAFSFNPPRYTNKDYKNWKEDWELINGYPFSLLPSPGVRHAVTLGNAFLALSQKVRRHEGCNCRVYTELDWIVDENTVVRPDLFIACKSITTTFLTFTPSLVLEVESPNDGGRDRQIKFNLYRAAGLRYYLIANYERETLDCYELIDGEYRAKTDLSFELDAGCTIGFDALVLWE